MSAASKLRDPKIVGKSDAILLLKVHLHLSRVTLDATIAMLLVVGNMIYLLLKTHVVSLNRACRGGHCQSCCGRSGYVFPVLHGPGLGLPV